VPKKEERKVIAATYYVFSFWLPIEVTEAEKVSIRKGSRWDSGSRKRNGEQNSMMRNEKEER
jgi:hypothetical protein